MARLAADADFAAHQQHDLTRHGEPEAGAAEAPRGGTIHLHKGIENLRLFFRRNANAGVADFKADDVRAFGRGTQFDVAAFGEFDGIGGDV